MARKLARNKEIPSGDTIMARKLARNKERRICHAAFIN